MIPAGRWLLAMGALLWVTACSTPEAACRDGVKQMKARTQNLVGVGLPDEQRLVLEKVNTAETQLATGNHAGCQENLEEARVLLNRSQRTNQQ